jgi:hypothetical protein
MIFTLIYQKYDLTGIRRLKPAAMDKALINAAN